MPITNVFCKKIPSSTPLEIFYTGPDLDLGPLPAFFYFALSAEESLCLDPFNQPIAYLQGEAMRCFSFTLPKHGGEFIKSEAMHYWAKALMEGEDLFQSFIDHAQMNIANLIGLNIVQKDKIALGGLSRGGFIACHLAARINFKALLGFAPLTDISFLTEFQQIPSSFLQKWDLNEQIPRLINNPLRFYMGNFDQRVGTKKGFEFIYKITECAIEQKVRSPQVEFITFPSIGNKGHGTPPAIFKQGADWIKTQLL